MLRNFLGLELVGWSPSFSAKCKCLLPRNSHLRFLNAELLQSRFSAACFREQSRGVGLTGVGELCASGGLGAPPRGRAGSCLRTILCNPNTHGSQQRQAVGFTQVYRSV